MTSEFDAPVKPKLLQSTLERASRQNEMTVHPSGASCARLIEGVSMRDLVVHTDDRGTVCEMYDPRWNWHSDPMVFSYYFTIRPGRIKGWGMHKLHDDRYCLISGEMKVVFFDPRPESSTFGVVSELYISEQRRQLLCIPRGVWHANENVGAKDVVVVNFPTIQYDHSSPDKYCLPLDTDLIPYKFNAPKGH